MKYKYKGKTYDLYLNDEGKIACEYEEISVVAGNVEEAKEMIRKEHVTIEAQEKTKVICNAWGNRVFAETTGKGSNGSVWISFIGKEGKWRSKVSLRSVWLDTEENRKIFELIDEKLNLKYAVEDEISALEDKLVKFEL